MPDFLKIRHLKSAKIRPSKMQNNPHFQSGRLFQVYLKLCILRVRTRLAFVLAIIPLNSRAFPIFRLKWLQDFVIKAQFSDIPKVDCSSQILNILIIQSCSQLIIKPFSGLIACYSCNVFLLHPRFAPQ
jgi:ABC-type phosphate transport system permease subunit